jgi:VCBS repeat-containing protein
MGNARFVGRVGALAVAFGVGTAIATGQGVAQAETDGAGAAPGGETGTTGTTTSDTTDTTGATGTPTAGTTGTSASTSTGTRHSSTTRRTLPPTLRSALRDHGSQPTNVSVASNDADDADLGGGSKAVTDDNNPPADEATVVQSSQAFSIASPRATSRKWTIVPSGPSLSPPLGQSNALQQTTTVIPRHVGRVIAPAVTEVQPLTASVSRDLELPRLRVTPPSAQTPVAFATAATPAVTAQAPARIVLGLLGFIGAQPAAATPVAPFTPIRSFLEIVFAVARRIDAGLFNETPTAAPAPTMVNTRTGVVLGNMNAQDADGDQLTYQVVQSQGTYGTLTVNADGTYRYQQDLDDPAPEGATDSFTVLVSDDTNPHLHLFSQTGHVYEATVTVPVTPNLVVIKQIPMEPFAHEPVVSPDGKRVYIVKDGGIAAQGVVVIDTATNQIVPNPNPPDPDDINTTVTSPLFNSFMGGIAIHPSGDWAYVTNGSSGELLRMDIGVDSAGNYTYTVTNTGTDIVNAEDIAFSADGSRAYIIQGNTDQLVVINTANNSVVETIDLVPRNFGGPGEVVVRGSKIYVTNIFDSTLTTVDVSNEATPVVTHIDIPRATDVAVTADGRAFVTTDANIGGSDTKVYVYNTTTGALITSIDVGAVPSGIVISPDGKRVFVNHTVFGSNAHSDLTVIDTSDYSIVEEIPLGDASAEDMVFNADGTRLYVTGQVRDYVTVVAVVPGD